MPGLTGVPADSALRRLADRPVARDLAVVLVWFVALGVLAAVLWWQLTPLAEYTRTATSAQMDEEQLGREVSADGWYVTIAAVGGLLSGVGLLSLRRRDPLAMVVLVALGGLLCGWVMLRVGLWLGPADPAAVLRHAAVGAKVPLQLEPKASGVIYVWPITALLGAVAVIWGIEDRSRSADSRLSADQSG
jgi:CHASE2 domain-containing sensor protein